MDVIELFGCPSVSNSGQTFPVLYSVIFGTRHSLVYYLVRNLHEESGYKCLSNVGVVFF